MGLGHRFRRINQQTRSCKPWFQRAGCCRHDLLIATIGADHDYSFARNNCGTNWFFLFPIHRRSVQRILVRGWVQYSVRLHLAPKPTLIHSVHSAHPNHHPCFYLLPIASRLWLLLRCRYVVPFTDIPTIKIFWSVDFSGISGGASDKWIGVGFKTSGSNMGPGACCVFVVCTCTFPSFVVNVCFVVNAVDAKAGKQRWYRSKIACLVSYLILDTHTRRLLLRWTVDGQPSAFSHSYRDKRIPWPSS